MKNLQLKNLNKQFIEIVIPTDKDNLYYEPTDKLHKFDLIQVFYGDVDKKVFIKEDILIDIIQTFLKRIAALMDGQMDIKGQFEPGRFGYFYNQLFFNMCMSDVWDNDIFPIYALWSGINLQVVMYSLNQLVYLEIFPVFNNFGEDESDEEDTANFKKFMENYAPIGVMKLDKNILLHWRQQVRDFFELKDDTIPY